jgi:predicted nicotinamide N-methyase
VSRQRLRLNHVGWVLVIGSVIGSVIGLVIGQGLNHSVGLSTWPGGLFSAEFVLHHKKLFAGRSVLELGAGVGFTSLVLCYAGCKQLITTDYEPEVLQLLESNMKSSQCCVVCRALHRSARLFDTFDPFPLVVVCRRIWRHSLAADPQRLRFHHRHRHHHRVCCGRSH